MWPVHLYRFLLFNGTRIERIQLRHKYCLVLTATRSAQYNIRSVVCVYMQRDAEDGEVQ